ncbi:MAG: DNA cytosine methyltransferase [Xanthomarina gelatinilytica]|uniref:DNA cytosine methyltransferase n=1 Tax=Xanthomarina gelatinilytica TaxID=1137281 RepID=UPI003A84D991
MKFVDLFCGIGGFRIAFESLGGKCVFSSDIDKYACETYKKNFNEFPLSDITKIDEKEIPNFDILCAGFPCQPFSIGGLRKGFQDTRGTLFFDIERIIKEKRPKAFILENVKGLVNHDKGKTLETIINKLADRVNGRNNINKFDDSLNYDVYYKVINSKNFGVPQNRERIYIIGFDRPVTYFKFPNGNKEKKLTDIIDYRLEKNTISTTLEKNIENHLKSHKKYTEIKDLEYLLAYEVRKSRSTFRFDNLAPTLTAKMGTGGNNVPVLVNQKRKLSTDECLKIQGYPENFKIKPNYSQSYKQIGNSVSVPVIKALAKEIINLIEV